MSYGNGQRGVGTAGSGVTDALFAGAEEVGAPLEPYADKPASLVLLLGCGPQSPCDRDGRAKLAQHRAGDWRPPGRTTFLVERALPESARRRHARADASAYRPIRRAVRWLRIGGLSDGELRFVPRPAARRFDASVATPAAGAGSPAATVAG